jgi:hypothetical protein
MPSSLRLDSYNEQDFPSRKYVRLVELDYTTRDPVEVSYRIVVSVWSHF